MAEMKAKKKGIVLLHDIHAKTQLMVKYLVPKMKAEGYTFVRLDEIQGLRPTQ
jgi:peptidoglycan/xylan/chitin deacetylase (PgdA/CDA1 family)